MSKITFDVPIGVDATKLRAGLRAAVRDAMDTDQKIKQRRSWERPKNMVVEVDHATYQLLLKAASLSASLLPYTEQGAAAMRPNEYCELSENLKRLGDLLPVQSAGTGAAIDDLLSLLQDLEKS